MADDSKARLLDLIETAYDCATDETRLWGLMSEAADLLGAQLGALLFRDDSNGADLVAATGYRQQDFVAYRAYFWRCDIRFVLLGRMEPDRLYADGIDFDPAVIRASEVQSDFYRPIGGEAALGIRLFGEERRDCIMSFHFPLGQAIETTQMETALILSRHVKRALQMQRQLAAAARTAAALATALDRIPAAVALARPDGRLVALNRRAELLLARPGSPLRSRQGRIDAVDPSDADRLRDAMRVAGQPGGVEVPPLLRLAGRDGAVAIMVTRVPRHDRADVAADTDILIFMTRPDAAPVPDAVLLRRQFGLSPAEAEIAVCLYRGLEINQIAKVRGAARETVRTQVKHLLWKLGVRTQGQTIALVGRSLAALPGREEGPDS